MSAEADAGSISRQLSISSFTSVRSLRSRVSHRHDDLAAMAGLDNDTTGVREQASLDSTDLESLILVASGCVKVSRPKGVVRPVQYC